MIPQPSPINTEERKPLEDEQLVNNTRARGQFIFKRSNGYLTSKGSEYHAFNV